MHNIIEAVTNTRFARLHDYLNTMKVLGYTTNEFGVLILAIFIYLRSYVF